MENPTQVIKVLLKYMINEKIICLTDEAQTELIFSYGGIGSEIKALNKNEFLIMQICKDRTFTICDFDGLVILYDITESQIKL